MCAGVGVCVCENNDISFLLLSTTTYGEQQLYYLTVIEFIRFNNISFLNTLLVYLYITLYLSLSHSISISLLFSLSFSFSYYLSLYFSLSLSLSLYQTHWLYFCSIHVHNIFITHHLPTHA